MAAAVVLAWLFPEPGSQGGILQPEKLNKGGIALIFFLHGLLLSSLALRAGVLSWRLHVVVQLSTFVVFPLLGWTIWRGLEGAVGEDLRLGFFYLCALPSTVSSSVALTAAARGNVPAAVFNAAFSSVLGIFITPLWVGWIATTTGHAVPVGKVILDLTLWLFLPLAAGQFLRPLLGRWAEARKKGIQIVDRCTILLLVYTSFCDSLRTGVWTQNGVKTVVVTVALTGGVFAIMVGVLFATSRACGFSRADKIAAVFCGSKKSLATGVPMAGLIFGAHPALSAILLPVMIYHTGQLIAGGFLASRWSREP